MNGGDAENYFDMQNCFPIIAGCDKKKCFKERVNNRIENSLLLKNYDDFYVKILLTL